VDSSFFEVFRYKLLDGDATAALQQPKGVFISQELIVGAQSQPMLVLQSRDYAAHRGITAESCTTTILINYQCE
jgi:hypothetical protein